MDFDCMSAWSRLHNTYACKCDMPWWPSFYMLEMIKHNPFIFQIITKLHLFDQINITINIFNEHFDLKIGQKNNYLEWSCNNFLTLVE